MFFTPRNVVCYNVAMQYTLWVVSPYSHSECFREVAQSLQSAFIELGHGCEIITTPPITRENVIILGAHLLHPNDILYLKNPIVWQLEQMPDESDEERARAPWTATYVQILRRAEVWDYSRVNIETLGRLGIEAKLLEVGYAKCLTRIENVAEPDIDVLFIGSMNDRRHKVLTELNNCGVKVVHAFDCYGLKRDMLVARAKIILNVHFFAAKIFEVVRCSYMLANRKCVVSETGLDKELEDGLSEGIAFVEYGGLVDRCVNLLGDSDACEQLGQRGFEVMSKRSQTEYLKAVL